MIRVINHGSACCVIEADSLRILTDPWLTGTAYLGAWEREHTLVDPVNAIGPVDRIWISHLHEDHLHEESLRLYLRTFPAPIWVGTHCPHLRRMLEAGGFPYFTAAHIEQDGVHAYCLPNPDPRSEGIDSVLVVVDHDSAVVNLNDNPYCPELAASIRALTGDRRVTALIPYTGAGPYPQCYEMGELECLEATAAKSAQFLDQFSQWASALNASTCIPFSAGYRLRGPLADLNPWRGIPSQEEVPGATVLPVRGAGPHAPIPFTGYAWESDPVPTDDELRALIVAAEQRAPKVSGDPLTLDIAWGTGAAYVDATPGPAPRAHETITVDARLLRDLLTRRYHWNVAEVGSCLRIKRHGAGYDPRTFRYLYRLHT